MSNNNKPKYFIVFKIVGFIGIILAIIGFILACKGFDDFESNNFMIGGLMATFGLFIGVSCLVMGFRPEITKMSTKSIKYIQQENKEDLKDIISTTADIASEAVTKTTTASKQGIEDTIFCKHCGAKIDFDSKFCNKCGKEQ
jgi:ribosomal protein L40E